jgi:hypothetical protein
MCLDILNVTLQIDFVNANISVFDLRKCKARLTFEIDACNFETCLRKQHMRQPYAKKREPIPLTEKIGIPNGKTIHATSGVPVN